jgi:hypothetical protein
MEFVSCSVRWFAYAGWQIGVMFPCLSRNRIDGQLSERGLLKTKNGKKKGLVRIYFFHGLEGSEVCIC